MTGGLSIDMTGRYASDLHDVLRDAAHHGPLATDTSTGAIVIMRQHDVESLAHDSRLQGIGLALFDVMAIPDGLLREWYRKLMFTTEGDYHRRIRSLVSRAFTPRSVGALRGEAADMATAAVKSVRSGGDLVNAFSTLATRLMCRLLGVPDSDVTVFRDWLDALSPVFAFMTPEQIAAAESALAELLDYVETLAARRRVDPGPDLITALLAAESDGDRLAHDEAVTMIANLLVAGHDTAGSQIPCSLFVALQHPGEVRGADRDDVRLANVVSETMRLEPSIGYIPRTTTAPVELHGETIPPGSMVFLSIAAAGRDESAWRDPDRFDPNRYLQPDTPRPLGFGAGTHYCLGKAMAQIALEESLRAALAAEPALHLTEDAADIPWRQVLGRSPQRLTVDSGHAG